MNQEALRGQYPLPPEAYQPYLRRNLLMMPSLTPGKIGVALLFGGERSRLKTPVTGDLSLVLFYRNKEGAVSSCALRAEDLDVLQLQGARTGESYRLTTGMDWVAFFAHQIKILAQHPESGIRRLIMVHPNQIVGLDGAKSEEAIRRYEQFLRQTWMSWSNEEQLFVADIR